MEPTPDHIRAIAQAIDALPPRAVPAHDHLMKLSGLEPVKIGDESLFVNVGERANVTGSKAFARLILAEQFEEAVAVARQQVENGAQVIDVNMDEAMLDSVAAMARFLNIAGGCCGTTPEHIAQIAQRVGRYQPRCCGASLFQGLAAA